MHHVQPFSLTRGRQQQSGVKNMLRFFVLLMFVFRFGEASHPGPPCSGFVLGLLNPTGLLHKSDLINQLPQGSQGTTWLVSETHLTQPGCEQFKRALKLSKSPYKLLHGDTVPPKQQHQSLHAVRGKEKGVGFLTSAPGRALMHSWPSDIAPQNRCHVAGFQYGQQWLQGGVFYGNAFQSGGVSTRESNNRLLSHIVHRICDCARGPRFIGGISITSLMNCRKSRSCFNRGGRKCSILRLLNSVSPFSRPSNKSTLKIFCSPARNSRLLLSRIGLQIILLCT